MIGIGLHIGNRVMGGGAAPATLLLDAYPSAAFAFSVRKLRTAYTGSAIRVRRSSDNAEQDIGFVSGYLDTTTLLSFCGASNGFVTTWYDQSGNARNGTQTTAANQPQIVSSGGLITMNGFASLQSTQNQARFDASRGGTYSGNELSIFNAIDYQGTNSWYVTADGSIHLPDGVLSWGFSNLYGSYRSGTELGNSIVGGQNFLGINIWNNLGQMKSYVNNSSAYNGTIQNAFNYSILNIMNQQAVVDPLKMQECIIYEADKTSDKSAIQTNINAYYGIY